MTSLWKQTVPAFPFSVPSPPPSRTDVAVIGGGMTGVLTALLLQEAGASCIVLEAGNLGDGQSGNTTAKITCQHGLCYALLEERLGSATAALYASSNLGTISHYEKIATTYGINCNLERLPAILYTRSRDADLEAEACAARRAGIRAELRRHTDLPFPISLALSFPGQAQFHPLKFLYGCARQLRVWCGARVTQIHGHTIYTEDGDALHADKIVYATHYPTRNFPGMYFSRLYQSRSYAIALRDVPPLSAMYYGIDRDGISLRSDGGNLILIGGAHRTGVPHLNPYTPLIEAARNYYPGAKIRAVWSAQDCMSPDGLPLIGQYSSLTPDHYVATGYSKWGMSGSMLAAEIISGDICGTPHPAAKMLSPSRFGTADLRRIGNQSWETLSGLSRRFFQVPAETADEIVPGDGAVVLSAGMKRGVWRDADGGMHGIRPVCSHMGCELAWNADTHTWDCPCHGSRFTADGTPIDAPATKPLSGRCLISEETPRPKHHKQAKERKSLK